MRIWLLSLLVCALFAPGAAHAWTDAHVREAHATLALDLAEQRVAVTLDLAVEVRGGWLERLDLTGLDEGMTPEPGDAAYAVLEGGEQVPGKLSVGAVTSVRFQRRDGLRRGVHHVVLRYNAPLAQVEPARGGDQRVAWTLPGWEAGLMQAVIEVRATAGLRPVADAEVARELVESRDDAGSTLRFSRVHVPRASPWTVAVEAPASSFRLPANESKGKTAQITLGPRLRTGAALGGALFLLALLRRALRGRARGRTWLGPLEAGALAALGALCWAYALPLALLCWAALSWGALWTRGAAPKPLPFGRVAPLHAADLARLRVGAWRALIGVPFGEIGSLCGLLELGAVIGVVALNQPVLTAADPWALGLLCVPFGAVAGSRWWGQRDSAEQVKLLLRAAQRTRMVACGMSLCAYLAEGKAYYPRLRLWPGVRYPGLLRIEVLVHARRAANPLWLSLEVEPASAAARWLLQLWPDLSVAQSAQGQRLSLRRPIDDVGAAAEQLLEHLSRESQQRVAERAPAQAA